LDQQVGKQLHRKNLGGPDRQFEQSAKCSLKYQKFHMKIKAHVFTVMVVNAGTGCTEGLQNLHPQIWPKQKT